MSTVCRVVTAFLLLNAALGSRVLRVSRRVAPAGTPGAVQFQGLNRTDVSERTAKVNALALMHFLESATGGYDDFEPKCLSHLKNLLDELDKAYTDEQLRTVLGHECQNEDAFPHSYQDGFKQKQKFCQQFADDLAMARDEELRTGDVRGYKDFCQSYYDHRLGRGKWATTTMAPTKAKSNIVNIGSAKCPCIGINGLDGDMSLNIVGSKVAYPADLGSRCTAWDNNRHPLCKKGGSPGVGEGWCAQKWCYVDPCNCDISVLPKTSDYMKGAQYKGRTVYFSYATCGGKDKYTADQHKEACVNQDAEEACGKIDKCAWDGKKCMGKELMGQCDSKPDPAVVGHEECGCIGIAGGKGTVQVSFTKKGDTMDMPSEIGSKSKAWDEGVHPKCKGDGEKPKWCEQKWCYVDPCKCNLPDKTPPKVSTYLGDATYGNKPIYFSYVTCGGKDAYTAEENKGACVNQKTEGACKKADGCAWTGDACFGKEFATMC